jgi:hypothetical protein
LALSVSKRRRNELADVDADADAVGDVAVKSDTRWSRTVSLSWLFMR